MAPTLRLFESLVSDDGSWLGSFTIADVAAAPALYRTTHTGMDMSAYPRLTKLRDALMARPGFQAAGPVQ